MSQWSQDTLGITLTKSALKLALLPLTFQPLLAALLAQAILMTQSTLSATSAPLSSTTTPLRPSVSPAPLSPPVVASPTACSQSAVAPQATLSTQSTKSATSATPASTGPQPLPLATPAQEEPLAARSRRESSRYAGALRDTLLTLSTKYATLAALRLSTTMPLNNNASHAQLEQAAAPMPTICLAFAVASQDRALTQSTNCAILTALQTSTIHQPSRAVCPASPGHQCAPTLSMELVSLDAAATLDSYLTPLDHTATRPVPEPNTTTQPQEVVCPAPRMLRTVLPLPLFLASLDIPWTQLTTYVMPVQVFSTTTQQSQHALLAELESAAAPTMVEYFLSADVPLVMLLILITDSAGNVLLDNTGTT